MNDREKQKIMIKNNLEWISDHLKKTAEIKNKYRMEIEKIRQSQDFSDQYKQDKLHQKRVEYSNALQESKTKFLDQTKELRSLIDWRNKDFDLLDPALTNALAIIQAGGKKLSYENLEKINENFRHNQNALHTLKDIYENQGISTSQIDRMIYNPEQMITNLETLSNRIFTTDGNLNFLASEVSKFAQFEGVQFVSTVDEIGMMDQFRKSAGLQTNEI